jgi:DNA-binding NtrC family response regulator
MGTPINLRDEVEIENRGDAERRHDEEMAQFVSLRTAERRTILAALRLARNCRRDAARLLGVSEATLYRRLKEYGQ